MFLFLGVLLIAGITIKLLPSIKLRGIFALYFLIIYLLLAGIEGLVTINKADEASLNIVFIINSSILFLHLPLIYYLYKMDHKKHLISRAREIFDKHVWHLDDTSLHSHLKR